MNHGYRVVTIARKHLEAEDIAVFELADPQGADLPPFSAGSHVDVEIAPDLVRQYSLCNNPSERNRYVIGVLKDPASRGGSLALHALSEGQSVRISDPRNHFELEAGATRSLLFGGGIGVTPILCMAERLAAIGADFEMHYGARSLRRCGFYDRIKNSAFSHRVHFHFDDGDESQKLDIVTALGRPDPGTHIYVCGPAGYIDFILNAAESAGFPRDQVHREYFAVDTSKLTEEGGAFRMKLASDGREFDVPEDKSAIEVLRENGIDIPTSCSQGVCGMCMTRVLEGIPLHRDFYMTDEEHEYNDQFTPCCSRSRTPLLVIDV